MILLNTTTNFDIYMYVYYVFLVGGLYFKIIFSKK